MTLIEKLQRRIDECDDGEGIPQWCIQTGKCTCIRAKAFIEHLNGATEDEKIAAEIAYDLGHALHPDGPC